jgi:AraC-like DNA-binding protein
MRLQFAVDDMPERQRFTVWAEAVHSTFGMAAQPLPSGPGPFRAKLSGDSKGSLARISIDADAHRISHRTPDIARRSWDCYRIYRESSPGAWFRFPGQEGTTRNGDMVIYDANLPFETQPSDRYKLELWTVPKVMLDRYLPALGRPLAINLSGHGGVSALAASYLNALGHNWDCVSEATMDPVADTLARLIGIACGAAATEQPDAVRAGRLVEVRRYIDRHLADNELSPAGAAASLGISVRALHLLFEPTGSSFSRTVVRRRLEECRAALLHSPQRPITDIAFAWGFSNLSSFYRAFHAAFGMAPGDLRETSQRGHRS